MKQFRFSSIMPVVAGFVSVALDRSRLRSSGACSFRTLLRVLILCVFSGVLAHAINWGQVDTFTAGTLAGWAGADPAVVMGGPAGPSDKHLLVTANGSSGAPNGKLVARNLAQWSGNYLTGGVARVSLHVKNFSTETLLLRAVLKNAPGMSSGYASTTPFVLPPGGGWQRVEFSLDESAMTHVDATPLTFGQLITNVVEFRIVHSAAPSIHGDVVSASLGLDDIQALSPPTDVSLFSVWSISLCALTLLIVGFRYLPAGSEPFSRA